MDYLRQKRRGHVFVVSRWAVYSLAHDLDLLCRSAMGAIFSDSYDAAADTHQPFMTLKFLYDRYKPDPITFPHNLVFVVVFVGWSLFYTGPLWTSVV
jgi:hypothetical protein